MKASTPITRTKAVFTSSFAVLFPSMSHNAGERCWRDLRSQIELEEIDDLARRMAKLGLAIVGRKENPGRGRA